MSSAGAPAGVMTEEKLATLPTYNWDVMEIGDTAPPMTHVASRESIADYCQSIRNTNPLYLDDTAAKNGPFGRIVAPPTYLFKCAPQRRSEIMHAKGYASPEEKGEKATPYAKSFVEFQRPIYLDDEITSTVSIEDRYERRGNQFVTMRVHAHNQDGESVGTYAYTIIWQQAPREERPAGVAPAAVPAPAAEAPVDPSDVLPSLTKVETQEAIDMYGELNRTRPRFGVNLHTDPGFAQRTIFGGTVNMGVATAGYCSEMLELAYGPGALLKPGATLEYKGIRPIRAGYEITLSGRVTARRGNAHDCEIKVVNQDGLLCGIGVVTVITE